jgi:hypothetical protein
MVPFGQGLTRRPISRTRPNRYSIRLVDDSTRSRFSGNPKRIHGQGFLQPLAQRGGRARMLMFKPTRETLEQATAAARAAEPARIAREPLRASRREG